MPRPRGRGYSERPACAIDGVGGLLEEASIDHRSGGRGYSERHVGAIDHVVEATRRGLDRPSIGW